MWVEIPAGTRVVFQGYYNLRIMGRITATGSPEDRIVFTSSHPELFTIDADTTGAWNGILFTQTGWANGISDFAFCEFSYSKATSQRDRGGVFSLLGNIPVRIVNCIFHNNLAHYGGAIYMSEFAQPTVASCLFTRNYALESASVFFCQDAFPDIRLCTIYSNTVLNDDILLDTAAIYSHCGKPIISGSILWNNPTAYYDSLQCRHCKGTYVRWNDIQRGHDGEDNIDADPMFMMDGTFPLSLSDGSSCIDQVPAEVYEPFTLDLAGIARPYGPLADMGCFELLPGQFAEDSAPDTGNPTLSVFPNPFNPETTIRFSLSSPAVVRLHIYNIRGQLVTRLVNGRLEAGVHQIVWNAGDYGSGVYLARLESGQRVHLSKLLLLK